jgi:DNA-binding NtrC family response regulator
LEVIRGRAVVDVAFVEFEIPDGCGFAILRELRERQPSAVRVLMSGNHAIRRFADATLAHLFLTKPFDPRILQTIARAGTRGRRGVAPLIV